ncbi:hypothetical protein DFH09DRAFT_1319743 [Mycena vulgaris]|nr:hypothetical protein DFH09DRAFT_1319743 [Mycena vulgaris]
MDLTERPFKVGDLVPPSPSLNMHHPFLALRAVEFGATTIEFAAEFVNLLSDRRLESHLSHSALVALFVGTAEHGPLPPPSGTTTHYVISGTTLASLFCFRNLSVVVLRPPVGFDINDSTAWDVAGAMAESYNTQIECTMESQHAPTMTLAGLRAFAIQCKVRSELNLSVDPFAVPPSLRRGSPNPSFTVSVSHHPPYLTRLTSSDSSLLCSGTPSHLHRA